jgi:hypothetical protein
MPRFSSRAGVEARLSLRAEDDSHAAPGREAPSASDCFLGPAVVVCHRPVPRRTDPQLPFSFARPPPRKGGLEVEAYRDLVERLRHDASRVAERFGLPHFELDADRPDSHERFGICFDDGRIRVRLVHARTGRPLRYSALIDTVVHELAHLRYLDHGPRWEALYRRMLEWCRRQGVYQPRRVSPPAARSAPGQQLPLLGRGGPNHRSRRRSGG